MLTYRCQFSVAIKNKCLFFVPLKITADILPEIQSPARVKPEMSRGGRGGRGFGGNVSGGGDVIGGRGKPPRGRGGGVGRSRGGGFTMNGPRGRAPRRRG